MKKIYSLICSLLLAQGAMATDYDQLKKVSNAGNTVTISAEGQKKGVYILRISDGKQTHVQKVVVR